MFLILVGCSGKEEELIPEGSVLGRWNLVGSEGFIQYEFTKDKRYTFYKTEEDTFETIEALLATGRVGNDWWYDGNKVVVDLNFGNYSVLLPKFVCNNNVINWFDENNELNSIFFKEGYNYSNCNE